MCSASTYSRRSCSPVCWPRGWSTTRRRHRQHRLDHRSARIQRIGGLQRQQSRDPFVHPVLGRRVRPAWRAGQRRGPPRTDRHRAAGRVRRSHRTDVEPTAVAAGEHSRGDRGRGGVLGQRRRRQHPRNHSERRRGGLGRDLIGGAGPGGRKFAASSTAWLPARCSQDHTSANGWQGAAQQSHSIANPERQLPR